MAEIRSFIAIELSDELKTWLDESMDKLSRSVRGVRWVRTGNMHLTVRFLGNIEESLVPEIGAGIEKIAGEMREFELDFGGVGGFPNLRHPRVLWIGVQGGEAQPLRRVHEAVELMLEPLGIKREAKKRFHPHLTLGRARGQGQTIPLTPESLPDLGTKSMKARTLTLFRSELGRGGPTVHTPLAVGRFQGS